MNLESIMKNFAQFVRAGLVMVFAVGFFAVFAEGAMACFFSPNKITSSMQGSAARKTTINCQSPETITCSVSGSLSISSLTNHKCTGTPPNHGMVFAPKDDESGSVSCTISGGPNAGSCTLTVEKYGSSSTCKQEYCKTTCTADDDTTQTGCKSVCTDTAKPNYCPPKNTNPPGSTSPVTIKLDPPTRYHTVQAVLQALLDALQGVIVVLSLVFIVIGAVLYITSAGNQARVTSAKLAITAALIGLAIGIVAPSLLKEIAIVLGWGVPEVVAPAPGIADILLRVLNFLLGIVGILAIIMLVVGGIMFLGAAGDMNRIGTAKKIVTFALIGIVVALASLVIVRQLAEFFAPTT